MTLPLQIKADARLAVVGPAAPFTLEGSGGKTMLAIDGRRFPLAANPGAPVAEIARCIARVPRALRNLFSRVFVSPVPNPADEAWAQRYELPVRSGMGALSSGDGTIVIYPYGISTLHLSNGDLFVRGLMHELGHCWSLHDWAHVPGAKKAWLAAIASDPGVASRYAQDALKNSGLAFEDAAETTALYFLTLGTDSFESYRATMPARFALLAARFP